MIQIRWSKRSIRDLQAIRSYLQDDRGFLLTDQTERIWEAAQQLSQFPLSGAAFTLGSIGRVLAVSRTPYMIYYRFQDGRITIATVRHGAQARPKRFPR